MSAREIIAQIKLLPAHEQALVVKFIAGDEKHVERPKFSIQKESDGLPVIRGDGGTITFQAIRKIETLTP